MPRTKRTMPIGTHAMLTDTELIEGRIRLWAIPRHPSCRGGSRVTPERPHINRTITTVVQLCRNIKPIVAVVWVIKNVVTNPRPHVTPGSIRIVRNHVRETRRVPKRKVTSNENALRSVCQDCAQHARHLFSRPRIAHQYDLTTAVGNRHPDRIFPLLWRGVCTPIDHHITIKTLI